MIDCCLTGQFSPHPPAPSPTTGEGGKLGNNHILPESQGQSPSPDVGEGKGMRARSITSV
jgi:hypothetical protein